jgi:hypothetical protein
MQMLQTTYFVSYGRWCILEYIIIFLFSYAFKAKFWWLIKYNTHFTVPNFNMKLKSICFIGVRTEARRPLGNEIRFCIKGNCNFVGHISRSFQMVWGCLIIKNEMSRYIEWIANWRIPQCKHIQIKLSYSSYNRALRFFFINHFVVHRVGHYVLLYL